MGIDIRRCNTTIVSVTHYMSGEPDSKVDPDGACPYTGFICINQANNVRIEGCNLTGHTAYKTQKATVVSQGTYDTNASNSNNVTWYQCTQTNDILDDSKWCIMTSNFCKNLAFDNCKLSRFDAHQGVHNATVTNTELTRINAIGSGIIRVENCIIHGNNVVYLRNDYGSTWNGDVFIKDVTLNNTGGVSVFSAAWYNHYFGYKCHLPNKVVIDNLTLKNDSIVYVYPSMASGDFLAEEYEGSPNVNPITMPKTIVVKNNKANYTYRASSHSNAFNYLSITLE